MGSVYIFEREKEEWRLRQRLAIRPGQPWDLFGSALSLKKDSLLIGAPRAEAPQWENGAAYLYQKTALRGGSWSLLKTLSSPHTLDLGAAVALSDGNIVVGENYENSVGYVRSFAGGLSSWNEVQRLDSPDVPPWIHFGQVLLLSKGWLLASNSRFASGQVGYQPVPGMVHAFLPQGNGQWVPFDTLASPQPTGGDAFGYALASNERSIFVGAPALYRSSAGAVYEYQIGP